MITTEATIRFIVEAHKDQKYGDLPFVVHPMQVARHFTEELYIKTALLHDVVEDTEITLETILNLFGNDIAIAVDALTRRENESYLNEYINRVSKNHLAKHIKIADLQENIHSAKYHYFDKYAALIPRYTQALELLRK